MLYACGGAEIASIVKEINIETEANNQPNEIAQEQFHLTSLSQLLDETNNDKTAVVSENFDLQGNSLEILPNITLLSDNGLFSNGKVRLEDLKISNQSKKELFSNDIVFEGLYTQVLYPEWLGAQGDGISDDKQAIENAIQFSHIIEFDTDKTYLIETPIQADRLGSIEIRGNNAKIISSGFISEYMLVFNNIDHVTISDLNIDGQNHTASGLWVPNGFTGQNLDLRNFYSNVTESIAIRLDMLNDNSTVLLEDSVIENMKSEQDGIIGNSLGASRAIQINWNDVSPSNYAHIKNNSLSNAFGDDGDLIQITQLRDNYDHSAKTIIENNHISNGTRRLIKATASNIEVINNTLQFMQRDHPEGIGVNKTYAVAYAPFKERLGPDGDFLKGSIIRGNHFNNETQYEADASLGLIQTVGALIEENTFTNGKIVLARHNIDFAIDNNELFNATIELNTASNVQGESIISNNTASLDSSQTFKTIDGFFIVHPYNTITKLTIESNHVSVIENTEESFLGFFHPKVNTTVEHVNILNNTLVRNKGNKETTRFDFIYSLTNFGENSAIVGNTIFTDTDEPTRGLHFWNVTPPLIFSSSNNKNSFGSELTPVATSVF